MRRLSLSPSPGAIMAPVLQKEYGPAPVPDAGFVVALSTRWSNFPVLIPNSVPVFVPLKLATIWCVPSERGTLLRAATPFDTGAEPSSVVPSSNVTVPAFTVRPEPSVMDTLALSVALPVVRTDRSRVRRTADRERRWVSVGLRGEIRHQDPMDPGEPAVDSRLST